jgi:hypothetical protein
LDPETWLYVDFDVAGREATRYSVVLAVMHEGRMTTVRVYHPAHGSNEFTATC